MKGYIRGKGVMYGSKGQENWVTGNNDDHGMESHIESERWGDNGAGIKVTFHRNTNGKLEWCITFSWVDRKGKINEEILKRFKVDFVDGHCPKCHNNGGIKYDSKKKFYTCACGNFNYSKESVKILSEIDKYCSSLNSNKCGAILTDL